MDAYENYCLEGILKKRSTIKKENDKHNTFSEIYNVFGCSVILWCIFTVLFIFTYALAFINIQNKICFPVLLIVSFFFFVFSLLLTIKIALKEKDTNFSKKFHYQSFMPCIKIFLESYTNSDELIAYLNKSVSTLNQKYNSVTDKIFTLFLGTVVAFTISLISNKIDVFFNIDFNLSISIFLLLGSFLFLSYKFIKFVTILFSIDKPSLLDKTRDLIDLIDVYNLTIHQTQYSATNI